MFLWSHFHIHICFLMLNKWIAPEKLFSLCPFQKRLVAFAPSVQSHDSPAVQRIKSSSLSVLEQAAERYSQLEATARSSAPRLSAADCERECDALERIVDNHFYRLYPRHGLINEVSLTQLLTHLDTVSEIASDKRENQRGSCEITYYKFILLRIYFKIKIDSCAI